MRFEAIITVHAPNGEGFRPSTFREWLQRRIVCPGLDPAYWHTLVDVAVAPDGASANLLVHSEPRHPLRLDRTLRPVSGTPEARVRVLDEAGHELAVGCYPAPLHSGQTVVIGDQQYQVTELDWPHRNEFGICEGALDWQHATVTPLPQPPMLPSLDPEQPEPTTEPAAHPIH